VQLNLGDLMGGTSRMDGTEFGAYALLFLNCYQDGSHALPLVDDELRRIARVTPKVWSRIRGKVMMKFVRHEDGYRHKRVEEELLKMQGKSSKNRDNALKRWNGDNANALPKPSDEALPKGGAVKAGGNATHNTESIAEDKSSDASVDFKRIIFNEGLKYLSGSTNKRVDQLRPLLGKWCKQYGDPATATAIMEAQKFQAVEPVSYIEQFLKGKKHEAIRPGGSGDSRPNKTTRLYDAVRRAAEDGGFATDEEPAS
jgi:uncharacterized protein YdaU (DUF1376 family)